MKNSYSGAKLDMQPKNIKQEVGYLVLYEWILDVGSESHMVFQEGGEGPF